MASSFEVRLAGNRTTGPYFLTKVLPEEDCPARAFHGQQMLCDGNSIVQRGILAGDGLQGEDVVCKFMQGDLNRIRKEAGLYTDPKHLGRLQGTFVPRFFGYFEGVRVVGGLEIPMGCMILEYCGESITLSQFCDEKLKLKIIKAFVVIHLVGHLEHNDIDDTFHHVLVRDTKGDGNVKDLTIRIIDFDYARHHECKASLTIDQWAYEPPSHEFNCRELFDLARRMSIWTPRYISFLGFRYDIFKVFSVERLAKCARRKRMNAYHSEEYLQQEAYETLHKYFEAYSDRFPIIGHPAYYRIPLNIPGEPEPNDFANLRIGQTPPKPIWRPKRSSE